MHAVSKFVSVIMILTRHPQNYRNHLQNLRLLGAIVPQRASGRWLSVLRQRHACGVEVRFSNHDLDSSSPELSKSFAESAPFRRNRSTTRIRALAERPSATSCM